MIKHYSMVVARDYRTASKYEFVVYCDEEIVAREGFFRTSSQAKRAGAKAAQAVIANDPQIELGL